MAPRRLLGPGPRGDRPPVRSSLDEGAFLLHGRPPGRERSPEDTRDEHGGPAPCPAGVRARAGPDGEAPRGRPVAPGGNPPCADRRRGDRRTVPDRAPGPRPRRRHPPGRGGRGRGRPARPRRGGWGAGCPGPAPLRPDRGHGDPPPANRPRRRRARRRRLGGNPPVRSRHRRRRRRRRGRHGGHGRDLPPRPRRREDRRREAPGLLSLPRASRRGLGRPDARNARLRLSSLEARRARARARPPLPARPAP